MSRVDVLHKSEGEILDHLKSYDLMKLCRSCLCRDTAKMLFNPDSGDGIPHDMLYFFSRHILPNVRNDGLPDRLCTKCFDSLSAAFAFRKQCNKSDFILRKFLKSSDIDIGDNSFDTKIQKVESGKKAKRKFPGDDESNRKESVSVAKVDKTDSIRNESPKPDEKETSPSRLSESDLVIEKCDENFSTCSELQKHDIQNAQPTNKRFQCSHCSRTFSSKTPWIYHEKTHTGDRPFVCPVCGKSYIQRNNLVIHFRSHTGEKPFVCKECGKAFTNGASLKLHMPIHSGSKAFVCTICGKGLARSGELTVHMRTHTGEKPYVCQICSKGFIKKSSLQQHMYTHTGEKRYTCPICGHRVAQAGKLTIHMRTHSDSKPLSCDVCCRKFATKNDLKRHSKIHFGDISKLFTCNECGEAFEEDKKLIQHTMSHTNK